MPQNRRKVPFSGKQKKLQLLAKRQSKSEFKTKQKISFLSSKFSFKSVSKREREWDFDGRQNISFHANSAKSKYRSRIVVYNFKVVTHTHAHTLPFMSRSRIYLYINA